MVGANIRVAMLSSRRIGGLMEDVEMTRGNLQAPAGRCTQRSGPWPLRVGDLLCTVL